jgi:hypothetical protein
VSRLFTLAEAESLIPEIEGLLREGIAAKSEYQEAEREIRSLAERVMLLGGVTIERGPALEMKARREAAGARLRGAIERVQESGCVVKDLDIGLVDFPTLFRDKEVYLCWKLGEPEIAFWHGMDEGFAGRKPIDRDFREHHRGDPAQ